MIKKIGYVLVSLMVLLQAFYAIFAYVDPESFALTRGTTLAAANDVDWVIIYASRTLFLALVVGFLLIRSRFDLLIWVSFMGTVMPITDAWLAYQTGAPTAVVVKHIATVLYLILTALVLTRVVKGEKSS